MEHVQFVCVLRIWYIYILCIYILSSFCLYTFLYTICSYFYPYILLMFYIRTLYSYFMLIVIAYMLDTFYIHLICITSFFVSENFYIHHTDEDLKCSCENTREACQSQGFAFIPIIVEAIGGIVELCFITRSVCRFVGWLFGR